MHVDLYGRSIIVVNSKEIEKRDSNTIEKWKTVIIDGKETNYIVSNTGKVKNKTTDRLLIIDDRHGNGYSIVKIGGKHHSIHRLVAKAFINIPKKYSPEIHNSLVVNHIDGYKWHNYAYNLEWCTNKENMEHAHLNNLNPGIIGENSHLARMTNASAVKCCFLLSMGYSTSVISAILGVSKKSVQHIKNGESWKYLKPHFNFKRIGKAVPYTLKDDDIHEICKLLESKKYTDTEIANKFNISREYVRDIRNRKRRLNISKLYNF